LRSPVITATQTAARAAAGTNTSEAPIKARNQMLAYAATSINVQLYFLLFLQMDEMTF
jgi:hypothetical protein